MTDRHDREYVPSMVSGLALFEAGVCIESAERMRDMGRRGYNVPDDHEITAYFQYEIDSLRLFAEYLGGVSVPRPVPECPHCVAVGNGYCVLAHYAPTGQRRCIRCGRHYDTSNGEPKEVGR